MPNEFDPIINQWYYHLDKGQRFMVAAVDEYSGTVEVQHFDGDIEEYSLEEWAELDIELSEEPENWAGAMDFAERDDLGTEITDTRPDDWNDPLDEFAYIKQENPHGQVFAEEDESADEDYAEEELMETPPGGFGLDNLVKRRDGKYEEILGENWVAEYYEDPESSLWQVELFKRDALEWVSTSHASLEQAQQAAYNYYSLL